MRWGSQWGLKWGKGRNKKAEAEKQQGGSRQSTGESYLDEVGCYGVMELLHLWSDSLLGARLGSEVLICFSTLSYLSFPPR